MANWTFLAIIAVFFVVLLWWSARHLPAEKWQIAASIPIKKNEDGAWWGVNLTYYGFFSANAMAGAVGLFFLLCGSLGVPPFQAFIFLAPLLSLCFPASRLFARWVEKKPATATIGGAFFAGIIIAPWLGLLVKHSFAVFLSPAWQIIPLLAALSISYVMGEALGRLACISFGCCYGLPLEQGPRWARILFRRWNFVFNGPIKKASYESGFDGKPLIPIQMITSVVYGLTALGGILLFMQGHFLIALLGTNLLACLWRAYSETLRADWRGGRRFSTYQKMSMAGAAYTCLLPWLFDYQASPAPAITTGLEMLWNPTLLLGMQGLWIFIMLATGTSKVTSSLITFQLNKGNI